ncbi:Fic family protein (plasmid) [Ensifer adhaerens]|uniref:Fic/DOC family protein n=1 Tax=Ensifer adhaerens TaxID=106592 RepID=UPI0023A9D576|nr:Fic family protein [Ensifer adhaerens]WDZ82060.1 Fic family protein [Ensifer adhaerens]
MADDRPKGSYTYPTTSDDPDRTNVLKNRWGIETHSELRVKEYRATAVRMQEIAEGDGPKGNFDKAHLKAIHGYIFQDVYEWAGHTRNESPLVEGQRVEPIGGLSKGGTSFLPGSRIEMGLDEALKPIRDPRALRNATPEEFADRAAKVLSELNYVHPFREGNGRAQEAFISELGRHYGREIDFSVITRPRIIEASIETTNDPSSPAMKHVIEDAMNPARREAIRSAFEDLREVGEEPLQHHVRTARPGEEITGTVLGHDDRIASLVTDQGIVVADRADLPERLPDDGEITFTARSDLSRVTREQPAQEAQSQAAPSRQPQQDHDSELKAIEAQMAAQRSRERDDDDRGR